MPTLPMSSGPPALPAPPGHCLHDPPQFIGQTGTVHRITDRGDVRVQFSHKTRWTFHPGALTKVHGGAELSPFCSLLHPFSCTFLALGVPSSSPEGRGQGLVGLKGIQSTKRDLDVKGRPRALLEVGGRRPGPSMCSEGQGSFAGCRWHGWADFLECSHGCCLKGGKALRTGVDP